MALIKCIECGKSFSDKAVSCPECGCPTEVVLKENNSDAVIAKKKESGKQATEMILSEVKKAKEKARRADSLFDSRNRAIQRKASSSIDLFSGYATSRVVEIQADAREACDDLYTTYQTLVETLDGVCRPLLDSSPGGEAIKAVADAIRYFNEESEIESNFTASFNGTSLGNVSNSKYVPSISNKMIQKFWESKYAESPYAIEYEKNKRIEAEKARKMREEERIRAEAERKKKAEEKKKEDKRKAEETAKAKKQKEAVVAETKAFITSFEKSLDKEIEKRLTELKDKISEQINIFDKNKKECEENLKNLGVFAFAEKKRIKEESDLLTKRIFRLKDPEIIAEEERKMRIIASGAVENYKKEIESYLEKRFPNDKKSAKSENEYYESPEFAKKTIPAPPGAATVFI